MAVDHEIEALAARADAVQQDVLARLKRLRRKRAAILAYRRLFLDPATGRLKPDAIDVIADISRVAGLGDAEVAAMPDVVLRDRAGRRALALHIIARIDLDGSALRDLASNLRGNDHA